MKSIRLGRKNPVEKAEELKEAITPEQEPEKEKEDKILPAIQELSQGISQMIGIGEETLDLLKSLIEEDSVEEETYVEPEQVIKDPAPHMTVSLGWLGLDEEEDTEDIRKIINVDPMAVAWCGYAASAILGIIGIGVHEPGLARSYASVGSPLNTPEYGCLCVWRKHVAFFIGYADRAKLATLQDYGKVRSMDDWEKVKSDENTTSKVGMVFGGNQSDEFNISPAEWFTQYSKFIGYRRVDVQA